MKASVTERPEPADIAGDCIQQYVQNDAAEQGQQPDWCLFSEQFMADNYAQENCGPDQRFMRPIGMVVDLFVVDEPESQHVDVWKDGPG